MKKIFIASIVICSSLFSSAQYVFTPEHEVPCTRVKSQDKTGTCWSFATTSFVESEALKGGLGPLDLSEMFIVRNIYKQKAINYVLRQGKANFSQGSLAHDQLNAFAKYGIVPEIEYEGNKINDKHDHGELVKVLKGFLDGVIAHGNPSQNWMPAFDAILDVYLGAVPERFQYKGKEYDPKSFAASLSLDRSDYIGITSFEHHPYGSEFILEIPDNFSNGMYYNVTLDQLYNITIDALAKGYTISWDGDVSEKSFVARSGLAILPTDKFEKSMLDSPVPEKVVTPSSRQASFYSYSTTDDHLMHIVGTAIDQNGTRYFKVKNSWGEISDYNGFLFMSESYFKAKTVSIYLNKNAINPDLIANN